MKNFLKFYRKRDTREDYTHIIEDVDVQNILKPYSNVLYFPAVYINLIIIT